ncbi:MAG: heme-binding protein [Caulobacteraceae bacterium]
MKMLSTVAMAAFAAAGVAFAQAPPAGGPRPPPPPPPPSVPAMLALEAAQTALTTCTANGYNVGASVVDSSGATRVLIGVDAARQGGLDSSIKKAFTAVTLATPTSVTEAAAKTDDAVKAKLAADPRLFARAGGVPILIGGKLVGAIGVGGAPGGEKDEACALAGLAKIKDRLK